MNKFIFLIDQDNNEEVIYNAIPAERIETLKATDTYDSNGQAVSPEDAGAWLSLDTQKAVDVANKGYLSESKFYVFINDNDNSMNVIAGNEEDIKNFIENGWDANWNELKHMNDVTTFYDGNGDINDFDDASFTNLIKDLPYKIGDTISAYDNSSIFDLVQKECEDNEDYTLEVESCEGFNYWDGSNWKSVILSYEHNDYYTGWEVLDNDNLVTELNEAIENMKYVGEGFGITKYETEHYIITQSQFASDWSTYQIVSK